LPQFSISVSNIVAPLLGRYSEKTSKRNNMQAMNIIVTGAPSGLGKAVTETLLRQGQQLFAGIRDVEGRNAGTVRGLEDLARILPGKLTVLEVDVACGSQREAFIEAVLDHTGNIDVLINNAGVMYSGITEAFSTEQFRRQLEINTIGPFHLDQLVVPGMRRRNQGLIIHVTSIGGGLNFPFFTMYSATKAALESIAEGLRHEVAGFGIESIVVEPGPVVTQPLRSNSPPIRQHIAAEYGDIANVCSDMQEANARNLSPDSLTAQRPDIVADTISRLIAMSPGERPFRTIAGSIDFGLRPLNELKERVQLDLLAAWGLTEPLAFNRNRAEKERR
jgi:NAD(P)-dependent dehydrogenase (short-subunit alcohol dehydrogenase family)